MRMLAIVLVVLGALILGYQGVTNATEEQTTDSVAAPTANSEFPAWKSPVMGGIAVVGGLLLLAIAGRQE